MADINPFLGDFYPELVAKYASELAARNSGANEEVEDVELAKFRGNSGGDFGLKTVVDEDANKQHREASYRAALQHNMPFKNARVAAVQSTSSLPVYDPDSLKDVGVSRSSTSRTFPSHQHTVDSHAAQSGVNQQSTSDEEEHLKDLQDATLDDTSLHVSDDIAASEEQPNGIFQLCFVAPKSISDCIAFVKYEVHHLNFLFIARYDFPAY